MFQVRCRKWRRVCCTLAEKAIKDAEEEAMLKEVEKNQHERQVSEEAQAASCKEAKWYPGKFIKKAADAITKK